MKQRRGLQAEVERQQADLEAAAAEKLKEANATKARAKALLEEQRDEVKRMNQMILYSTCATVRDTQVRAASYQCDHCHCCRSGCTCRLRVSHEAIAATSRVWGLFSRRRSGHA